MTDKLIDASAYTESRYTAPMGAALNAGILGLGMCVPDRILTNNDIAQIVDTSDEWIVSRTGIRERRVGDTQTATSDLAVVAAQRALEDAGIDAASLDLVLCATTTGDYIFPATACLIQERIGATRAGAFDLAAACSGFCYGLAVASGMIQGGMMQRTLDVGADMLSKLVNWEDRATCILFGDGAGAAVLGPCGTEEGLLASTLGSDGSGAEMIWMPAGGTRTPITAETLEQKLNRVSMQGREVYRFAAQLVPEIIEGALRRACVRPGDIRLLVMHQANIRIIQAVAERLDIAAENVFINVERYGNTSAASVPIALTEAVQQGRINKGDLVVTVGFGAGLTWAANVIRWNR